MVSAIMNAGEGFGVGFQYALCHGKAEEVRQGKNEYIATLFQTGEIGCLCALVSKVATPFFSGIASWSLKILSNVVPLLWLPVGILLASVKQRDYGALVAYFPKTLGKVLPTSLNQRTITILNFITDHLKTGIKVTMLAGVVALAYFGSMAYSCAFAGILLFHEIDLRGYLPRKVSLFAETYLPLAASACFLVCGGTLFLQAFAAIDLLTRLPFMNQFVTHKMDALVRYYSPVKGISLAEFEAPLIQRQDLTYEEINAILDSNQDYEINPAHCSKSVVDLNSFPKDYNFDKFLTLFNDIKWNLNIVKKKLRSDERFLDHLTKLYPGKDPKDQWTLLAADSSNDPLFINWMNSEFTQFVKVLKGEIRPQGEQKDLAVSIEYGAMILTYLQKPSLSKVEKEDIFLKLTIEAGGYCARAFKRALGEIVDEAIMTSEGGSDQDDAQTIFERKTMQNLQNKRRDIVQEWYKKIAELILPDQVSQDVHGYDIYRKFLSLGFYPLTPQEREQMSALEIPLWNMYSAMQQGMLSEYRYSLDSVLHDNELGFANYMQQYILSNKRLSESQKEALLEKQTEPQPDVDLINHKFHQVMLVKLGVLRKAASEQKCV